MFVRDSSIQSVATPARTYGGSGVGNSILPPTAWTSPLSDAALEAAGG